MSFWFQAAPLSDSEMAQAQTYFDQDHAAWEEYHDSGQEALDIAACEQNKIDNPGDFGPESMDCQDAVWTEPQLENYTLRVPATFADQLPNLTTAISTLAAVAALIVAASLVTAEYSSGAMTTWLTYEPRRNRVYWSKAAAAALAAVALTVGMGIVALGVVAAVTAARGQLGTDIAAAIDVSLKIAGRGLVTVAASAIVGTALGFLMRHAAWVLGTLIGYLVLVESILGSARPQLSPWLAVPNTTAWMMGEYVYYYPVCTVSDEFGGRVCDYVDATLYQAHGGWYLLTVVVVLAAAGWVAFRRSDVD